MNFIPKLLRFVGFLLIASGAMKFFIGNSSPLHYSPPSPAAGIVFIVVGVVLLALGARRSERTEKR